MLQEYCSKLKNAIGKRGGNVLVTHDTPAIPRYDDGSKKDELIQGNKYQGSEYIYAVVNQYKPRIHIYGHCQHPTYYTLIDGVHYLCADARVLVFIPTKTPLSSLMRNGKMFQDEYIQC